MIRVKRIIKYCKNTDAFVQKVRVIWINSCSHFLQFTSICPFSLMALFWILQYLVALLKELNCIQNYHTIHVVALYHCVAIWIELFIVLGIMLLGGKVLPRSRKHYIFLLHWFSAVHYNFFLSLSFSPLLFLPSPLPFYTSSALPTFSLSFYLGTSCSFLFLRLADWHCSIG